MGLVPGGIAPVAPKFFVNVKLPVAPNSLTKFLRQVPVTPRDSFGATSCLSHKFSGTGACRTNIQSH